MKPCYLINTRVSKSNNAKTMVLSKCTIYVTKNSRFIKNKKQKGILSSLGLKTPLNKFSLSGDILF